MVFLEVANISLPRTLVILLLEGMAISPYEEWHEICAMR